jgi:hypothetical protein
MKLATYHFRAKEITSTRHIIATITNMKSTGGGVVVVDVVVEVVAIANERWSWVSKSRDERRMLSSEDKLEKERYSSGFMIAMLSIFSSLFLVFET